MVHDKTHNKIYKLYEELDDVIYNAEDKEKYIAISDKGIIAYLLTEKQILYYKYSLSGLKWYDDKIIELLNEDEKPEKEDYGKFINDRYYVFYRQLIEDTEDTYYEYEEDEENANEYEYKSVTDIVMIYDLYTGNLIHHASTCSRLRDAYYRPFEHVDIDYSIPFFINDKIVLRPVVLVLDDCGDSEVIIKSVDNNKITRRYSLDYVQSILAFFYSDSSTSDNSAAAMTESSILLYDIYNDTIKARTVKLPNKIDVKKCLYYKHKNFFILYDGSKYFIAIYYCINKSKYYYGIIRLEEHTIEKTGIVGYIMHTNNSTDCIGLVLYSQKGVLFIIIYDSNDDKIKYSQMNYDIMVLGDKTKLSFLKAIAGRLTKKNLALNLLDRVSFLTQFNGIYRINEDYGLEVTVGDKISAFMNYHSSPLQLQAQQHYVFENQDAESYRWAEQIQDCIWIYEQPCIVKFFNL